MIVKAKEEIGKVSKNGVIFFCIDGGQVSPNIESYGPRSSFEVNFAAPTALRKEMSCNHSKQSPFLIIPAIILGVKCVEGVG